MKINFTNNTSENVKMHQKVIKTIFKSQKEKKIMNIIFVGNEEIQQINRDYRQIDRVTDVISFALNDNEFAIKTEELGDIFICLPKAVLQAEEYGHSLEREVGFLSVHGYLHLLGYDHQTPEEEKEMFSLQEEILAKANLKRGE